MATYSCFYCKSCRLFPAVYWVISCFVFSDTIVVALPVTGILASFSHSALYWSGELMIIPLKSSSIQHQCSTYFFLVINPPLKKTISAACGQLNSHVLQTHVSFLYIRMGCSMSAHNTLPSGLHFIHSLPSFSFHSINHYIILFFHWMLFDIFRWLKC